MGRRHAECGRESKMMERKNKIAHWLENVQTYICIFLLALMSLVVIVQVFSRYIFNFSFVWAEELVRYLMIWMVMLGSALVQAGFERLRADGVTTVLVLGDPAYYGRFGFGAGLYIFVMPTIAVNAGIAGTFVITSEAGVAAGIRRIEAATGHRVYLFPKQEEFFVQLKLEVAPE